MDDAYWEMGPFGTLYEEWIGAYPKKRDPRIEARLAEMYREAWSEGTWLDQSYVLYFIFDTKDQTGADLIIEGLQSTHPHVAKVASTLASVTHGRVFDLGPELRAAYRALVRRFPENDIGRLPLELYGHIDGDVDDWEARPFVNVYEDWMATGFPRDEALARRLVDMYEDAWRDGDGVDRAFVLHFLTTRPETQALGLEVAATNLVVEGLRSDDGQVARSAMFYASSLLHDDVDLGPDIREVIDAHERRIPEDFTLVVGARLDLDKREGKRRQRE